MDWCHPDGVLFDKYGFRAIYNVGSSINVKLEQEMKNGDWFWPPARSEDLVPNQSKLEFVDRSVEDTPRWVIYRRGVYSAAETWDAIRTKKEAVDWWDLVWFPLTIPRHRFILRLAIKNSLSTGERLLTWGYNGDTPCSFCRGCVESRENSSFNAVIVRGFGMRFWVDLWWLFLL
jgi:hypothetical protein